MTKAKNISYLVFLALCLMSFNPVLGQTTYVSNGSSTNWSSAAAWTPNGIPVLGSWPYDNVVINNTINYTGSITSVSSTSIVINNGGTLHVTANFTTGNWGAPLVNIDSGGTLTVDGALNISGSDSFNNSGTLNAGSFTLSSAGGSDVTNSGIVNVTNDLTFNVARNFYSTAGSINVGGKITLGSSSSYFHISNTPIIVSGDFNVNGSASLASIGPSLNIGGNWNNTGAVATSLNATLNVAGNLYNTGSSSLVFNGATIIGGLVTGTGATTITANSTFQITGALALSGSAYLDGTGIVSWGSFSTDGSGSAIVCVNGTRYDTDPISQATEPVTHSIDLSFCAELLPVLLTYFEAKKNMDEIVLQWQTASEINSNYFVVERSKDGVSFETVGWLASAGTSNKILNYQLVDQNPILGQSYYRLKQFDFDGAFEIFKVVEIDFKDENSRIQFAVYPTIVDENVTFSFISMEDRMYSLEIINDMGNIIKKTGIAATKGLNNFSSSLLEYSSGCYFARISSVEETSQIIFFKR